MKKCRHCKKTFEPFNSLQVVCSTPCAIEYAPKAAKRQRETEKRQWNAETRRRKRELNANDRRYQLGKLQGEFNAYIRERDSSRPCISCDRHHAGKYDAGHYRSIGSTPELRFDELNCHKQCVPCNQHKSGNAIEYRIGLVARIGLEAVEYLEGPHEPKKYTLEEIKQLRQHYKARIKELKEKAA